MPRDPGEPVPEVTATTQAGDRETVAFVAPTVLCFVPADVGGVASELASIDDQLAAFRRVGAAAYGVSTADAEATAALAREGDLDLPLLADPDEKICEAFDVPVDDGECARITFVCAGRQVCGLYEGAAGERHGPTLLQDLVDTGLVSPPED
jgi:peroxiredoxin Q/BCP